jgi:UDP:flavonoid glycosyltransferase YjiC (YdhE family)
MRVLISSTHFAGHLRPLLPYARALRKLGHEVLVSAPLAAREAVLEAGFDHVPSGVPNPEQLAATMARIDKAKGDDVPVVIADAFVGKARSALPALLATVRDWKPDVILRDSFEFAAPVAADVSKVPCARVTVHSTGHEAGMSRHVVGPLDMLRSEQGLDRDNGEALRRERSFTAFPASLDGTGEEAGWGAPFRSRERKVSDPAGGPRPAWAAREGEAFVYITFGTVSGRSEKARSAYVAAVAAVAELPVCALLTTGPVMDPKALGTIPDNVTVLPFVPQDEVLPYTSLALCHGGSGTLLEALARGIPVVVIPLFADQPANARSVERTGAGIAVGEIEPASVREALQRIWSEPSFRAGAARIADEIEALATPEEAVEVLLQQCSQLS